MPRHLTSDEKLESLKNKYDPSYAPELDEIAPKKAPPSEMEEIQLKKPEKYKPEKPWYEYPQYKKEAQKRGLWGKKGW